MQAELAADERFREAGFMVVRAVNARLLAHDIDTARATLEVAAEDDRYFASDDIALELADAAKNAERWDLVSKFLGEQTGPQADFIRAHVAVHTPDGDRAAAQDLFRSVMADEHDERQKAAAFALLAGSIEDPALAWDAEAERLIAADAPSVTARMKAQKLAAEGDREGAEAELRPYQAEPDVMRILVSLKVEAGDWDAALRLTKRLIETSPEDFDYVRYSDLLRRSGDRVRARTEFLAAARNEKLSTAARAAAYGQAAQMLHDDGEYAEMVPVAAEWSEFSPDDDNARWAQIVGLVRLTRYQEALHLWQEHKPQVRTIEEAYMLAGVQQMAADPESAIVAIWDLAERFPDDERLLLAVIGCAINTGVAELPDPAGRLAKEALHEFPKRFPDSKSLRAYTIDPDDVPGSVARMLADAGGSRQTDDEIPRSVAEGRAAVAVLAAVHGQSTGETWQALRHLPTGFRDEEAEKLEREGAAKALSDGAALWDPSSLYITGGLGGDFSDLVVNALPASALAQSALDDAAAETALRAESSGRLGLDEKTQQPLMVEADPDDNARARERRDGTLGLARRLQVRPDQRAEGERDDLEKMLEEVDPPQFEIMVASIAVARREGLALFSDDRWIRAAARAFGVPAFGTIALIDALAEENSLSAEQRDQLRRRLYHAGAHGLNFTTSELIELGRSSDWKLTNGMRAVFNDVVAWLASPARMFDLLLPLLQDVYDHAPDEFDDWVARLVDAGTSAMPERHDGLIAAVLLNSALGLHRQDEILSRECLGRLIVSLRHLPAWLKVDRDPREDILIQAIVLALKWFEVKTAEEGAAVLRLALRRVPEAEQERIKKRFVRRSPPNCDTCYPPITGEDDEPASPTTS
jgi:tetratricopeptide (TPR) repeat protein